MNHTFINIETPQSINERYSLFENDFSCKKCIRCNFILANHINEFDVFYYDDKEIYNEYLSYETLTEQVDFSCEEFIIKNIIE